MAPQRHLSPHLHDMPAQSRRSGYKGGMKSIDTLTPCPCGNPTGYAQCCGPLHKGTAAATAAQLMRSRYSAYVLKREDYLLASWHPDTRPASLRLAAQQPPPTWLGLEIRQHQQSDDDHATVEFVARYRLGGGRAQRQHETSRFVREAGRWYYLDGELGS